MNSLETYRRLLDEMAKYDSALAVLGWDLETHMPPKGVDTRSAVTGMLSRKRFEILVSDELGRCLAELRSAAGLSEAEEASVRRVGKRHDRGRAIPPALVEEKSAAESQARAAWQTAREASDFVAFRPHLEKMVGYARTFAELYGYEEHPYDALIEDYEPGMTCRKLTAIIDPLRAELVPFLRRLTQEGTPPDASIRGGTFDQDTQRRLSRRALEIILYDFEAGSLDDVAHPFTMTIGPGDVRVTNRYLESEILSGLFGALHEGGHALYNQGMPAELYALGLANGASNGIHESQALMIENQVGRSLAFWRFFQPVLAHYFPQFKRAKPEKIYAAANVARPSLIRVDADEVTYNLHIMLRFEIEAGLMDGSIQVADLPALWNDAMKRYLGIVPPNDAAGVLQDVHWSIGAFGYFPSYMLGSLYAAQLHATMRKQVPDLDASIARGDLRPLVGWLRENVHGVGGMYEPGDLVERVTGESLNPAHFMRYIGEKYGAVYGL